MQYGTAIPGHTTLLVEQVVGYCDGTKVETETFRNVRSILNRTDVKIIPKNEDITDNKN